MENKDNQLNDKAPEYVNLSASLKLKDILEALSKNVGTTSMQAETVISEEDFLG